MRPRPLPSLTLGDAPATFTVPVRVDVTFADIARRAAALTQRLLAFSRRQSLQTRPTEVNALIRAMADLLQRSLSETTGFELGYRRRF